MRQALRDVDGVVDAAVSYDEKRADVRYHADRVQPAAMVEAIDVVGFSAAVIEDGADSAHRP